MTTPFLMIYLHEVRDIPLGTAGLLVTTMGVAGLAVTLPSGYLIDRLGAWFVLLTGTMSMLASGLTLAAATTPPAAAIAFVLAGLNLGVSLPAKNVLIASTTTGSQRQTLYALSFALLNLSWGFGGVLGGLYLDVDRTRTFVTVFVADALLMAFAAVVLVVPLRGLRAVRLTPEGARASGSLGSVLATPGAIRLCLLTFLVTFIGYGQLESGIPVFARQVSEISTRAVGLAFAVNTLLIGALQLWILRTTRGRRRTRVIIVFAAVWATAWLVLATTAFVAGTPWAALGFLIFVICFAFGEMIMLPLLPVLTNELASDRNRGMFNAVQGGALQLGGIAGPAVAGFVLEAGRTATYISLMTGGCVAVMVVVTTWERTISPVVNGAPLRRSPSHRPHR